MFVAVPEGSSEVAGFYTLSAGSIERTALPPEEARRLQPGTDVLPAGVGLVLPYPTPTGTRPVRYSPVRSEVPDDDGG